MKRKAFLQFPEVEEASSNIDIIEGSLAMLNQISSINKELLDLVTISQRSKTRNKQILASTKQIKMAIDSIQETQKEKITIINQTTFKGRDIWLLRRLVDRITDKIYRKNIFYQKYKKYLPNKILLHNQIIDSLKKLAWTVQKQEQGKIMDLFQFAQILKFLQLQNVLLWQHLISILMDNNLIESRDEILRQIPQQPSDSSQKSEEYSVKSSSSFNSYIQTPSKIEKYNQKFQISWGMMGKRMSEKQDQQNKQPTKRSLPKLKINQQIQVQIDQQTNYNQQSQKSSFLLATSRSRISKITPKKSALSSRRQNFDDEPYFLIVKSDNHPQIIKNINQHSHQLELPDFELQAIKKPENKTKSILFKNEKKIKQHQNSTSPIAKVKLTINQNFDFVLEHTLNEQQNKIKQSQSKLQKQNIQYHKSPGTRIIRNKILSPVSKMQRTIISLNTSHSGSLHQQNHIHPQSVKQMIMKNQNLNSIRKILKQQFNQNIEQKPQRKNQKQIKFHRTEKFREKPEYTTFFISEDSRLQSFGQRKRPSKGDLSNILSCNSYQASESKQDYRRRINQKRQRSMKCQSIDNINTCSNYSEPYLNLKKHLNLKQQSERAVVVSKNSINMVNLFCKPRKQSIFRIPTYYKCPKNQNIKNTSTSYADKKQQGKILRQIINLNYNSVVSQNNTQQLSGTFYESKLQKHLKKASIFKRSKQKKKVFQIYDSARRHFI